MLKTATAAYNNIRGDIMCAESSPKEQLAKSLLNSLKEAEKIIQGKKNGGDAFKLVDDMQKWVDEHDSE